MKLYIDSHVVELYPCEWVLWFIKIDEFGVDTQFKINNRLCTYIATPESIIYTVQK